MIRRRRNRTPNRPLDTQPGTTPCGMNGNGSPLEVYSTTENVSTGGAYFHCRRDIQPGLRVTIGLSIPYEVSHVFPLKRLEAEATVVRVSSLDDEYGDGVGIGIRFLKDLTWTENDIGSFLVPRKPVG